MIHRDKILSSLMRWFLLVAAGIVGYQMFVPPVVGLANQSDFKRVIGKFGYGPEPPAVQYAFIVLKYIPDSSYHLPDWEQFSSEDLFVRVALLVNKTVSKDGKLDIRVIGVVQALAFLAALTWLLYVTRALPARPLLWVGILLVTTDVARVAFFNSFYAETASYVFCLLLLAESIAICKHGVSTQGLLRWSIWAVLLVLAKPVNAPPGVFLGLFALRLAPRSWIAWFGATAILAAAVFNVATAPKQMTDANTYNLVFLCVLPESKTPVADAVTPGFDPGTELLSGTGAWSPNTGYPALQNSGIIGGKVTLLTIIRFYLARPSRLWRHIRANLQVAMLLRPDLGNFAPSAGYPPMAKSKAFSLWSSFHEAVLLRMARPLFLLLPISLIAFFAWRLRTGAGPLYEEFFAILVLCCLTSFLTASFGDGWETIKHMFLFNALLDAWLLSIAAFGWSAMAAAFSRRKFAHREGRTPGP
jgi:hypothetical protein